MLTVSVTSIVFDSIFNTSLRIKYVTIFQRKQSPEMCF